MKNDGLEIKCNLQNKSNWNYAWVMHRSTKRNSFVKQHLIILSVKKIQSDKSFPYLHNLKLSLTF